MTLTPEHLSQLNGLRVWAKIQGQTPAVPSEETCIAYLKEQEEKFHKDEPKESTRNTPDKLNG